MGGILTLTLWWTIAAIITVARPRAMNPYCMYSITAGRTTRLVWNMERMGPSMYPLWRRGKIQPSEGHHVLVLFLQSHQSSIGKSRIKCRYYCVFQTCFDYLFKPEHWHHHLGDLPSFSEETKLLLLITETMLSVCGALPFLRIISLRNSCHFLHVEVELQADGYIQWDTRLLKARKSAAEIITYQR